MFNWELIKKQIYIFGITTILVLLLKDILSTFIIKYLTFLSGVHIITDALSIFIIISLSSIIARRILLKVW